MYSYARPFFSKMHMIFFSKKNARYSQIYIRPVLAAPRTSCPAGASNEKLTQARELCVFGSLVGSCLTKLK